MEKKKLPPKHSIRKKSYRSYSNDFILKILDETKLRGLKNVAREFELPLTTVIHWSTNGRKHYEHLSSKSLTIFRDTQEENEKEGQGYG